ncbi:MAG: hypothetical protein C4581_06630 [Nitrospiraceae bacterium]|nr:MAG: hypothetical protein C4581_06630 [Nitrospiraceae bacterium]
METYTINKCRKCGANDFLLREQTVYRTSVNKNGILDAYSVEDYRVGRITCTGCGVKYSVDEFINIECQLP